MITNINDQKTLEEFVKDHRAGIIADAMDQYAKSCDDDHWGSVDFRGMQCDYNACLDDDLMTIRIWAYGLKETSVGVHINTEVESFVGTVILGEV